MGPGVVTVKHWALVVVLAIGGVVVATPPPTGASMNPPPIALMLARVPDSPVVFVVSTSTLFDPAHPASCAPVSCYLLRRTDNNGASFTILTLPFVTYVKSSLSGNLVALTFANARDGYALVREGLFLDLYVTLDGANSWHRQVIAAGERVLDLVPDGSRVVALIGRCQTIDTCTDIRQAWSTSAARKWTITPLPRTLPTRSYPNFFGVAAFGPNVWVTDQGPKTPMLYLSHDQGHTFTAIPAMVLSAVTACGLTAESAMTLWAQCPTGMMVSFYYSGDAGVHWTNISTLGFAGTGGGFFDPVSSALAYLDYGQTGPSRPRNLFRVTNAGRTSTAVGVLRCDDVFGLVFTDADHGLAICNHDSRLASTYLVRTTDGGATWSRATSFLRRF